MEEDASPPTVQSQRAPSRHIVDFRQVPLLEGSRRRRKRGNCCRCLCTTVVAVTSSLIGSGATLAALAIVDLSSSNCTAPEVPPACPGVCTGRLLDGTFSANVSRSKDVGPVTVKVSFYVEHRFSSANGTLHGRVTPISFEPHWLPIGLHPLDCYDVPFALSDNCTLAVGDTDDACLAKAFKADDVTRMTYRWDGMHGLAVTESIDAVVFQETFAWVEERTK